MNTKINKMVLLSALMIAIIGTIGTVSADEPLIVELVAGNNQVVGNVAVSNDGESITVKYMITEDGWCMTETHLQVAEVVSDIPQTKNGNPKVGKFDNSTDHDPCETMEYTIPIPTNPDSTVDTVYIAAHAVVRLEESDETFEETAWGFGTEFADDRNWAMYFTYTIE